MTELYRRLVEDALHDGVGKILVGTIALVNDKVPLLERKDTEKDFPGIWEIPSSLVVECEGQIVLSEEHDKYMLITDEDYWKIRDSVDMTLETKSILDRYFRGHYVKFA